MPQETNRSYLRRLQRGAYLGFARVHWTLTIDQRRTGWLNALFHARFRELLLHIAFGHRVCCPVYCLMPDHLHLLWMGISEETDQLLGMREFRVHLNRLLHASGHKLQRQGFDHVLRLSECKIDAFQTVSWYIRSNPIRAGLVDSDRTDDLQAYPYVGCLVPGYPELSIWDDLYWERFWRVYETLLGPGRP